METFTITHSVKFTNEEYLFELYKLAIYFHLENKTKVQYEFIQNSIGFCKSVSFLNTNIVIENNKFELIYQHIENKIFIRDLIDLLKNKISKKEYIESEKDTINNLIKHLTYLYLSYNKEEIENNFNINCLDQLKRIFEKFSELKITCSNFKLFNKQLTSLLFCLNKYIICNETNTTNNNFSNDCLKEKTYMFNDLPELYDSDDEVDDSGILMTLNIQTNNHCITMLNNLEKQFSDNKQFSYHENSSKS